MRVEYEMDQWEWQGTTRSVEIDPEDYRDMGDDEILQAVYLEIRADAEQNLHLVFKGSDVLQEIHASLNGREDDDEDDD